MGATFKSRFLRSTGIHSSKTRFHISISCSYAFFKADHLQYEFYLFVVWQFKISLRFLYLYSTTSLNAFRGLFGGASFAAPKTAEFANVLSALSIDSKVLVIVEEGNKFAELSARNLANVTVATPATASVLDIVNADKLLVTKEAISSIEEVLA